MNESGLATSSNSRRLVRRQLRKAGIDATLFEAVPGAAAFLTMIEESYDEFDRHRRLNEHSTRLASDELEALLSSLAKSERLFRSLARCSPNGIIYTDALGRCLYSNEQVQDLTRSSAEQLRGNGWWAMVHPDDRAMFHSLRDDLVVHSGRRVLENRMVIGDGSTLWVSTTVAGVQDESGAVAGWVANVEDIADRRSKEEQLSKLASRDSLTDLLNRRALTEQLAAMCRDATDSCRIAVALIDLDQFKLVNDTFGHATGDELLKAVADRLRVVARDGDLIARLGGDEFAIATALGPEGRAESFAQALSDAIHGAIEFGGRTVHLGGSIGVAVREDSSSDPERLLGDADTAMYRAKRSGISNYSVFDESFRAEVTRRFAFETELRRAVIDGSIRLAYQPIVDTDARPVMVEALARWESAELGVVRPDEFIPICEDLGLVSKLGRQLLDAACWQIATWRSTQPDLVVSVNVSSMQLTDPDFPATVVQTLSRHGLPAVALTLEITEGALLADLDQTLRAIDELRAHGVSIALDDFGTGFSSLSYLERLPVDYLKIDRSFITAMVGDDGHQSGGRLAETIIDLAHRFELVPIAEGVETPVQHALLREAGCELLQGYLFARPLAPADPRLASVLGIDVLATSAR